MATVVLSVIACFRQPTLNRAPTRRKVLPMRDRIAVAVVICLLGISAPAQTGATSGQQTGAPDFDARAVERATTISGRTCSNSLVGVTYELPEGMQVEDARTSRIVKARGERGRTGIGPEAEYILWGSGERHSIVYLCNGNSERGQVMNEMASLHLLRRKPCGTFEFAVGIDLMYHAINRSKPRSGIQ